MTLGDYLLTRLKELGADHIFGVPGDYNLGFLDQIIKFKGLEWVGTCNELNGAYAADGYARMKGIGVLVTTFGVGELSAINGIAGAYAEYAPVVHIVGLPSTSIQANRSCVHHTLGDGRFKVFCEMYKAVTAYQTILSQDNAPQEIDKALKMAWLKKRPVYIGVPSDLSYKTIPAPQSSLDLSYPQSNPDAVNEVASRTVLFLEKAKSPVVLIDICAQSHPMKPLILDLLNQTGLPFATMNMGKAIINESHPQFIGNYNGDFSTEGVQKRVESSDCIISFGSLLSDFNTGGFTTKMNANATVEIHSYYTRIHQSRYEDVGFKEVINSLITRLKEYRYSGKITSPQVEKISFADKPLTHQRLWHLLSSYLEKETIVIAETGTSMFGACEMKMPDEARFISQTLWASIGYSVGALLGVCLAKPQHQVILFVGDGSFQLTAQEVSTLERHHLSPTIFLIDNDGYTVERVIHGADMAYNDIQHWNYSELPEVFGNSAWTTTVTTEMELQKALQERKQYLKKMALITLKMEKMDAPAALIKISQAVAARNKYSAL